MKYFILFLISGILFFSFGYYSKKKEEGIPTPPKEESLCKIKCEEVERFKTAHARYLKTKEFMPQAVIALLAAIGMQFTREQELDIIQKLTQRPDQFKEILEESKTLLAQKSKPKEKEIPPPEPRREYDGPKHSKIEEKETVPSTELFRVYNESSYAQKFKNLILVNGKYFGFIKFKNGQRHDLLLEVNYFRTDKNEVDGDYYLQISDQHGVPYSQNRGSGGNKSVRIHPTGILILEASPTSHIQFQNSNALKSRRIQGRYIEKSTYVGDVILERE